jgi:hypothetical protein
LPFRFLISQPHSLLVIAKDILTFQILSSRFYCTNGKIHACVVLLIVSYRALQNRDGFTPLFKHKHVKAAATRRFSVIAKGIEKTFKALKILGFSDGAVRINPRRDAESCPGMLVLASLRKLVPTRTQAEVTYCKLCWSEPSTKCTKELVFSDVPIFTHCPPTLVQHQRRAPL